MLRSILVASSCLLTSSALHAQSSPAAEGNRIAVWVGAEVSSFNPDYGCKDSSPFTCSRQVVGIAPFVDANHLIFQRLGGEGEARLMHWHGPGGLTEASYLVGPRVNLLHFKQKLYLSAKVLVGDANITLPKGDLGNGSYFAYAPGVIVEYRAFRRWSVRADYEYQLWPSFKGVATNTTSGTGGLTPNGFSAGLSYLIFR